MGAGHHVYADKSDVFNNYVNKTCDFADGGGDIDDSESPNNNDYNISSLGDDSTENRAAPTDKIEK